MQVNQDFMPSLSSKREFAKRNREPQFRSYEQPKDKSSLLSQKYLYIINQSNSNVIVSIILFT